MELVITLVRTLAVSQLLLLIILLALSRNPIHVRLTGSLLFLGTVTYLIFPLIFSEVIWQCQLLMWMLFRMVPALMLLFVWLVFEEHSPVPVWIKLVLVADAIATAWSFNYVLESQPDSWLVLELLQATKVIIAGFSVYVVWRGRENDLVERRQTMRWSFIIATAITVLGVAVAELLPSSALNHQAELLGMSWIFLMTTLVNVAVVKINPQLRLVGIPVAAKTAQTADPVIVRLLERMQSERLYADHDLRIGTLAELVGLPPYQLRRKINQGLGYRNFNQFVNRYRVEEAGTRLLEDLRIPVLSVALDVGFRSMSSFNLAFQAHYGVSPTVYRSQSLMDS